MVIAEKETTGLVEQHKAIKSNMELLTRLLNKIAEKSKQGEEYPASLKKQIGLYCWSLYEFQNTIMQHIELDERIFKMLNGGILTEEIRSEHEEIMDQVDNIIRLAENSVNYKLPREVLIKCALYIVKRVNSVCALMEAHMDKEDKSLIAAAS